MKSLVYTLSIEQFVTIVYTVAMKDLGTKQSIDVLPPLAKIKFGNQLMIYHA
jgi:hypothetical protein